MRNRVCGFRPPMPCGAILCPRRQGRSTGRLPSRVASAAQSQHADDRGDRRRGHPDKGSHHQDAGVPLTGVCGTGVRAHVGPGAVPSVLSESCKGPVTVGSLFGRVWSCESDWLRLYRSGQPVQFS